MAVEQRLVALMKIYHPLRRISERPRHSFSNSISSLHSHTLHDPNLIHFLKSADPYSRLEGLTRPGNDEERPCVG